MDCRHLTDKTASRCYYCGESMQSARTHQREQSEPELDHVRTQVKHLLYDKGFSLLEIAEAIVRWEMSRTSGARTFRHDTCYDELLKNFVKLRDDE